MDDVADPVQPDEGQGGQGNESSSPYADYLSRIENEEGRAQAEEAFRAWDADQTRKFQGHADYRRQMEPIEQLGFNQMPQEQLQWLAQFHQALQNPETIVEWARGYAEQNGLSLTPEQVQQQADEWQDPSQQAFEQMLEQRLNPLQQRLDAYEQQRQQQDFDQRVAEARAELDSQVSALKQEHGEKLNEEVLEAFAGKYADSDPANAVTRGWEDYQRWMNDIEKRSFQAKVDAPNAPATGGGVDSSASVVKAKDMTQAATDYMRALNGR